MKIQNELSYLSNCLWSGLKNHAPPSKMAGPPATNENSHGSTLSPPTLGGVRVLDLGHSNVSHCLFNVYFVPQNSFNLMLLIIFLLKFYVMFKTVDAPFWPSIKGRSGLTSWVHSLPLPRANSPLLIFLLP